MVEQTHNGQAAQARKPSRRNTGTGMQLVGLGVLAATVATIAVLTSKSPQQEPFFRKQLGPGKSAAVATKQPFGPRHWVERKYPEAEPLLKDIANYKTPPNSLDHFELNFDWNRPEVRAVICGEVIDMRQGPRRRLTEGFSLLVSKAAVFVETVEMIREWNKGADVFLLLPDIAVIDFNVLWWQTVGIPLKTGTYKPEDGKWLKSEARLVFEAWATQKGVDVSDMVMPPAVHH